MKKIFLIFTLLLAVVAVSVTLSACGQGDGGDPNSAYLGNYTYDSGTTKTIYILSANSAFTISIKNSENVVTLQRKGTFTISNGTLTMVATNQRSGDSGEWSTFNYTYTATITTSSFTLSTGQTYTKE